MTHICVGKLAIVGSDNGLSPGRRQAIIWTNTGILLTRHVGTNFNENLIKILIFSFIKIHLKVSSAKWRPFCLGLNVLTGFPLAINEQGAQCHVPRLKEQHTTVWLSQYNGSIEFMVRWHEGPCGSDGGLKLPLDGTPGLTEIWFG